MDFNLTEEQQRLQSTAREFTVKEIEPIAQQIDEEGKLPDDLINKFAGIGLLGMTVPREYGGAEAKHIDCILAIEQLAYTGTGAWWLVAFNNSIPDSIAHFGSEEIKKNYLRPFCDGTAYASIQFTEDETGSDPGALITTALPEGETFVINGMKRFSTFGARNGYAVLYAKDDTGQCTAFILQKNIDGYTIQKPWKLMGGGGMEAVDVYLKDVPVHKNNMLGAKSKGFNILLHWIASEKIEQCAANVGIAQAALDEAVKYTNSRLSRGKPISQMQGIRWMLADMQCNLEASRWLTYRAAFLQDRQAANWMNEAAATKLFVVPTTIEIVETARRIHGAYGYTKDFKIERLCRAVAGAAGIATSMEINKTIVGSWVAGK
jgi:alkylation response protein AidB-like acyl-CoA dehydrogenase